MQFLKANTEVIVTVGPFLDITDGLTPETAVALSSADEAEIVKHGATAVVDISGATWAAVTNADGYYSLTLTTSHTDTEGMMVVIVQDDSLCLPVKQEYMVLAEAAYDSMFVAKDTGFMDVNIKAVSEDTTAADNLESACDNYSVTRGLTGTALPAAAADAAGGLPISDAGGLDLDAILADTNELQTDWTDAGRLDAILDELTTQGDTNETAIGALNDPTAAAVADAVWDEIRSGHVVDGSAGQTLDSLDAFADAYQNQELATDITGSISGSIGSLGAQAKLDVNAEVDTAFTTQMADSVPSDGTIATREQALYMILQFLTDKSVSSTTVTVKKVDGSTALMTFTLDDATTPTSITRAT